MKKLIVGVALCMLGWCAASAQSNGNAPGNGNGPTIGLQQSVANRILREAHPYFQAQTGISLGQLHQAYRDCICTIELVATNPPTNNIYLVRFGGGMIIVLVENNL